MIDTYLPEFESIRPYKELELPMALERLVSNEAFPAVARFVYPNDSLETIKKRILAVKTISYFQEFIMLEGLSRIERDSMTEFSFSGLDMLDRNQHYLFVSNHRDIVLDAFLLQKILIRQGYDSCQVTFGANLMKHPLIVELGRINKMFKVERGGSLKSFYSSMVLVSSYMRYCIEHRKESVWIAQRNGRTKDGLDLTEPSLLKMFVRSGKGSDLDNVESLNIVPVTVSYEWEPCDNLKAIELSNTVNGCYQKSPGEDERSILTGLMQPKGRVHLSINKPISHADLVQYGDSNGDFLKWVAELIDRRIYDGYRLCPSNYVAHDLLHGSRQYCHLYSSADKDAFLQRFEAYKLDPKFDSNAQSVYLGIYANPVDSKTKLCK